MTPLVTVAVPAYGDAASVLRLLADLSAQADAPLPVVVSDDASPEPLEPALRAAELPGLELRVVRSGGNGGPGAARNRALAVTETPWIAFLDADERAAPGYVARLHALAADPPAADMVCGRVVAIRPGAFEHATAIAAPEGQYGAGNLLVRTAVLREEGGFDERFYDPRRRLHFREDAELHFRLAAHGRLIAYDPELVVEHPPLPARRWTPVRLARRYYFDPLLAREHPDRFRRLVRERRVGPLPLRRARHDAALLYVAGLGVTAVGVATRRRAIAGSGALGVAAGWAANLAALGYGRSIRPSDVPALAAVAAVVPLTYTWHYARGVIAFRHWPRY
jgi:GT2 family glycosyltransferase